MPHNMSLSKYSFLNHVKRTCLPITCVIVGGFLLSACMSYPNKVIISGTPTVDGIRVAEDEPPAYTPKPTISPEVEQSATAETEPQPEEIEILQPVAVEDPSDLSDAQKEAVVKAANYKLDHGWYTKDSMIQELTADGFSKEEALYGAEHCYVQL